MDDDEMIKPIICAHKGYSTLPYLTGSHCNESHFN